MEMEMQQPNTRVDLKSDREAVQFAVDIFKFLEDALEDVGCTKGATPTTFRQTFWLGRHVEIARKSLETQLQKEAV